MAGNSLTKRWRRWFGWWSGFTKQKLGEVSRDEELSRWVKDEKDVVRLAGVVKHTTLMPRIEEGGRPETSVCRTTGLNDAGIWQRCSDFFDPHAPRKAIGRGAAPASTVYDEALSIDPNGNPYPEHADIVGWPYDASIPYEGNKQFWKIKAQRMAQHFRFVIRPTGL